MDGRGNGGSPVTGHEYRQKEGNGNYGDWIPISDSAPGKMNDDSFTVDELTNDTTYFFKVRAVNVAGGGAESSEVEATPAATEPEAPTDLVATPGNGAVTLEWTAAGDGGSRVTGHEYQQKLEGGSYGSTWTNIPSSAPGETNATRFMVKNLTNGTTYYFKVRAVNGEGGGAESNEATTTPRTVPEKPTDLIVMPGNDAVKLSWTAGGNGGSPVTRHDYRQKSGSEDYGLWIPIADSAPSGMNDDSFTVESLTNGTTYYFQVRAVNVAGGGAGVR